MASMPIDASDSLSEPAQSAAGIHELELTLAAVRRITGVESAHVLGYGRDACTVEVIAGTASLNVAAASVAMHAALATEPSFMLARSASRWVENPFGLVGAGLLITLVVQPLSTSSLLLWLSDPSTVARARLKRLLPDLALLVRQQLSLGTRLSDAEETRDAAREALDHGECGVVAVRGDHSIVFANSAGSRHLAGGLGLRLRRGVLRPVDHGKAIRFEAALDSVIDAAGHGRAKRSRATMMLLGKTEGAAATIIVIAPAGTCSGNSDPERGAAALVYILPAAQSATRGLATLCELHGLSRVESHLIAHLMVGLTITEAAAKMQVKVDTARTYLKQIFAKTGLHRQTELVTLMARYLRAVRGEFDFHAA